MSPSYTRPPLVAREPRSRPAARRRFRLAVLVAIVVLIVVAFQIFQTLSGSTAEDQGVIGALSAPTRS